MKSINLRNLWCASLLGAINGVLFAFVANPVSDAYDEWDYQRMIVEFNVVPPSMARMATPMGELLLCVIVFTLASYLAHRLWAKRIKSTIVLWQVVAVVAIVAPFVLDYTYNRLSRLVGAVQWRLEQGKWGELPGIAQDVSYPLILLAVAISLNFFYGAVIQKLSSHYPQKFVG